MSPYSCAFPERVVVQHQSAVVRASAFLGPELKFVWLNKGLGTLPK